MRKVGELDTGEESRDPRVPLSQERVAADEGLGVQVDRPSQTRFERRRLLARIEAVQRILLLHADAPQRPDPYLADLDLTAIGKLKKDSGVMTKPSAHLRVVK